MQFNCIKNVNFAEQNNALQEIGIIYDISHFIRNQ